MSHDVTLVYVQGLSSLLIKPLSSYSALSGVGSWGQQPKERSPDFPLPSHFIQLFPGDPEAFPGQPRDSFSSVSWVFPGVSYRWDVP